MHEVPLPYIDGGPPEPFRSTTSAQVRLLRHSLTEAALRKDFTSSNDGDIGARIRWSAEIILISNAHSTREKVSPRLIVTDSEFQDQHVEPCKIHHSAHL
jgi:hypothetical protein